MEKKAVGRRLSITLRPEIFEILKKHSQEKGITMSAMLSLALRKYDREEEQKK
jgi:hypothetical protein